MKTNSASYLFIIAGVVVVALIGFAVFRKTAISSPNDALAQCLTERGTKMFGAWWCPHCSRQKETFGTAFKYIDYTECSLPNSRSMIQICRDEGIQSYPTWRFADGSEITGEQTLEFLAGKSGCSVDQGTTVDEAASAE